MIGEPIRIECVGTSGGTANILIRNLDGTARTLAPDERLIIQTIVIYHPLSAGDTIALNEGGRRIWGGTSK